MKTKIFITGISGSGKSTVSRALNNLGYKAYDIEDDIYDLFTMIRKDTGKSFVDYDNSDLSKVGNARWICDIAKLKKLLDKQTENLAFYCGTADNNIEVMSLFDNSILLKVSPEILDKRLLTREGTNDYANTKEGRKKVLDSKDEFDNRMIKAGMLIVDGDSSPEQIAKDIIKLYSK